MPSLKIEVTLIIRICSSWVAAHSRCLCNYFCSSMLLQCFRIKEEKEKKQELGTWVLLKSAHFSTASPSLPA